MWQPPPRARGGHLAKRAAQCASLMLAALLVLSGGVAPTLSQGPSIQVRTHTYTHMNLHVHVCIYTDMYIYTDMHTHVYTSSYRGLAFSVDKAVQLFLFILNK